MKRRRQSRGDVTVNCPNAVSPELRKIKTTDTKEYAKTIWPRSLLLGKSSRDKKTMPAAPNKKNINLHPGKVNEPVSVKSPQ